VPALEALACPARDAPDASSGLDRDARDHPAAEAIEIIDGYMQSFRQAMEEGRVRTDSATDFNTLARLKAFLEGKADSRHGVITLEQMQARHAALRAQLESLDPAITGELPPRGRDRARGLLVEGTDGDQADRPAAAPRRRSDGGIERAPRRRMVAHERDDELVDDVPTADREESPRGGERVFRRADRARCPLQRPLPLLMATRSHSAMLWTRGASAPILRAISTP
jgi:hypothetical protein